ncbi:MAG: hypothetical protein EON54_00995 [Alcaligenaceae bacterium]|nr:MAG: hypothetical protein EON54_00995 [Alcaligenaceae bacterium]
MASKPKKNSKNKAASSAKNLKVAQLLALASKAPASMSFAKNKSTARLFEIVVLADILTTYISAQTGGTATVQNAAGGVLKFAGAPCSADKTKYSWFELQDPTLVAPMEAWVSVQFTTLSWEIAGKKAPPSGADKHEIDIGIFSRLAATSHYPNYDQLLAGISCKHFAPTKENVREALGLRRESAVLVRPRISLVPWLGRPRVPAKPPSPLYLASSSTAVHAYDEPIDALGVYTASTPFK